MRSWRHRSEALRRRRGEIHARPLQRGRDAEASAKANHRSRLVSHTAPPQKRGASTHQGRGAMPQSDQPQHRERQADHRVVRARQGRGEPTPWHQRTRRCAGELRPPAVPRGSVRSTAATAAATRGGAGRCSRNLNPLTRVRLRESGSDFSRRCYRAWAAGTALSQAEVARLHDLGRVRASAPGPRKCPSEVAIELRRITSRPAVAAGTHGSTPRFASGSTMTEARAGSPPP